MNCAICGKKLSRISDVTYPLEKHLKNYDVCNECNNRRNDLNIYAKSMDQERYTKARSILVEYLNKITDETAKDYLKNYIESNDSLINKNIHSKMISNFCDNETYKNKVDLFLPKLNNSDIEDKFNKIYNTKNEQIPKNPCYEYVKMSNNEVLGISQNNRKAVREKLLQKKQRMHHVK